MRFIRYTVAALLVAFTVLPAQAQLIRSERVSDALAAATQLPPADAPTSTNTPIVQASGGLDASFLYGDYNSTGADNDVYGFFTIADLEVEALGPQLTFEGGDGLTISSTFGPGNVTYSLYLVGSTYFLVTSDALEPDNGYEEVAPVGVDADRFGNPVGIQYDATSGTAVLFTLACGTVEIDGEEVYVQSYVHAIDLETAETTLVTELFDPMADGSEGNDGVCIIGASWDPGANIVFASDIVSDDIVKVDVATGEFIERDIYSFDNPILADIAFVQDSAWDPNTQQHYVVPFSVDRDEEGGVTAIASPIYVCESSGGCEYIADIENEGGWVEPLGMAFPDLVNIAAEDDVARALDSFTAFPNPTANGTQLAYTLENASTVQIDVYNVLGQHIRSVVSGVQAAGANQAFLDTADLPGGLYVVRFQTEDAVTTRSITVLD
ncbi:MAG: T9SS type A sorting domain-containing protein [Bacteroidota bacterium]